jgi:hypothetical protein
VAVDTGLLAGSLVALERAASVWLGCIIKKPKQKTATISSGVPITSRCILSGWEIEEVLVSFALIFNVKYNIFDKAVC